jgi:uncharacterized protein
MPIEPPLVETLTILKQVMVPMRDGVRLATDVYLPAAAPAPLATILCRTPYDRNAQRYVEPIGYWFARRGFAVVLQDLRGRGDSEGVGDYYHVVQPREGVDGYDTIEWIAAQPWSNGRVGMVGSSYPGLAQTRAAFEQPPHLTAIWPDVVPINSFHHQARMGGAQQLQMYGALFVHAQDAPELRDRPADRLAIINAMTRLRETIWSSPFKPGHTALAPVPQLEQVLIDYATRGVYDEYWDQEANNFERRFADHKDVPAVFTGGWYDLFAEATPRYYAAMAAQQSSPQYLIMGPWTHTSNRAGLTYHGDVDCGAQSVWGLDEFNRRQLAYFDWQLRDGPPLDLPPVQLFVMGGGSGRKTAQGHLDHGGRWRAEREWPLARTQPTAFFLHGDGSLRREPPTGPAAPSAYRYDPQQPVPTIAAASSGFLEVLPLAEGLDEYWSLTLPLWPRLRSIVLEGGAHQQPRPGMVAATPPFLPLSMRADVLVFQTEPLTEDVEVTGDIVVHLAVGSSAPDTDFTAKLIDVYPPNVDYPAGYHLGLTDSILRARFREGFEREVFMQPDGIYQLTIRLAPTGNLFKAGHRIRIDISSSNFPRFDRNPNTGEPIGRHTRMVPADNRVYHDGVHQSYVELPIIPAGSAPGDAGNADLSGDLSRQAVWN